MLDDKQASKNFLTEIIKVFVCQLKNTNGKWNNQYKSITKEFRTLACMCTLNNTFLNNQWIKEEKREIKIFEMNENKSITHLNMACKLSKA